MRKRVLEGRIIFVGATHNVCKDHLFCSTIVLVFLTTACDKVPALHEPTSTSDHMAYTDNPYYSRTDTTNLSVSDTEWRRVLPDSVYAVAREAGTERAFTGKYWDSEGLGLYRCAVCGNALFRSDSKFGSSCGWPSFFEPLRANGVAYVRDSSHGMERNEVRCGRCDSHLGHVFDDGPPPTHKLFCMNSLVLEFEPEPASAPPSR